MTLDGEPIGVWKEPSRDPENTGVVIDDVNGLVDVLCGHGTFISGVIRQRCPEAVILEVPIMASDGAALEDDIVTALSLLLDRHRAAKAAPGTITHGVLDVVNLSLGYYHETPDEADDTALHDLLQDFADEGVVVVACAGNDATRARFFPAAFAEPGHEGLVGVGATNPDDRSIALFSNVGDWVTAHAPGAGVVSTVPITLSGSLNPTLSVNGYGPGPRAGVDFDDFRSGFAVWSGSPSPAVDRRRDRGRDPPREGGRRWFSVPRPGGLQRGRGKGPCRSVRARGGPMSADDTVQTLATRAATAFGAYREGDVRAMDELVDLLTPVLWHTARAQGASEALAQDAVQTAWLRLVESSARVKDPQAVMGWLIVTVRRECWRTRTVDGRAGLELDESLPDDHPDPSALAVHREDHRVLWAHVERLTPRCQALLRVIAFADRPDYAAVSEALKMPVGSIGPTRGRCLASCAPPSPTTPPGEVPCERRP